MDGESVATHKGVRVDDVVDSLPVFPVSLLQQDSRRAA